MAEIKADKLLDARGLSCPMPMLKLKKEIEKLQSGQILEMWGTDPGTKNELKSWCEKTGNELLEITEESGYTRFLIRKK